MTRLPLFRSGALKGDNIIQHSPATPWYDGKTLMDHLESIQVEDDKPRAPHATARAVG